jgi:hypothetical protein
MAFIVLGYGLHFEESDDFIENNSAIIESIRDIEKNLPTKHSVVIGIGGGNWDLSYFLGAFIGTREYTAMTLEELNTSLSKEDYPTLFKERLAKYPELQKALEPYQNDFTYQIILNRE